MNLPFGRRRYQARHQEALADAYLEGCDDGRMLCLLGVDCPCERPTDTRSLVEAKQAGLFDGWVRTQCDVFDECESGLRLLAAMLAGELPEWMDAAPLDPFGGDEA